MIEIKSSLSRNLKKICEEHYDALHPYISSRLKDLSSRQSCFITGNLKRIITAKPSELEKVNTEFIDFCVAAGVGRLKEKNVFRGLGSAMNYDWFSKKTNSHYGGYDLAKKLNVKTCPYCNRSYTVTVADTKNRIVRPDFDHFFPRKQYPLLSLSFYNLIPSCSTCNRTLKNQNKVVYGKYIHPYEEGFGDALKINFFPKDTDSAVGKKTDFDILAVSSPIQTSKSQRCLASFGLFKLKELYEESHSSEIADIIRKHYVSNGRYLEMLKAAFPKLGSIDELYRIAFGNYYNEGDFEKRPLSKLTKDVVEQLVFTYCGNKLIDEK
ncbi:MAG: hypothetical protein BGP13_09975 [Sphingobacteriales bacterium 40-81]|nr:MAG: hypothetical protein BGP13_09975 [Sphingobacteriales bacterium 40-81]